MRHQRFNRLRASTINNSSKALNEKDLILKRDYVGALVTLDFQSTSHGENTLDNLLWVGYCSFHLRDYTRARDAYIDALSGNHGEPPKEVNLHLASVYYYMRMYDEAIKMAMAGPENLLQNRILYHCFQRTENDKKHMIHHEKIGNTHEDQLSLAAMQYNRGHYQESIDIYKRLAINNRDDLAINVFLAMCYFKLDYYDVSLEILNTYLEPFHDSFVAVNLKACNLYRLYNGDAAAKELKNLGTVDRIISLSQLIQHNMVVFSNGERASQLLPSLLEDIPEARLNLAIYYLRKADVIEAEELLKGMEPSTPQEYILSAVVNATSGQIKDNPTLIRSAQTSFQAVGASPSECDTIPGRQCMASCFFLLKQFDDVNIYLSSVKSYMSGDDDFTWNYGISLASTGNFKAAEEMLKTIHNTSYKSEYCFLSWLARCYVMNGTPEKAWELYLGTKNVDESYQLLDLIANDCYQMGHFLHAAKAFNILEKVDSDSDIWEGKRGACIGAFQKIVVAKEWDNNFRFASHEKDLKEIISMLKSTDNPQSEFIVRSIWTWSKDNGLHIISNTPTHQ
eukprot:CAMPEP_0194371002 /NCGR_PEP_ID=MMETSP0174-20130528/19344_1 /TAXON_ID=216777 /ORGANISM="Proboscia alata, Strain PI-D3" /LENGTH=565 /DNA_ID=CAMNT_0039148781 /DNA_START=107 /DNA_END=1804 /DNA_ORIENTATION=+